MLFNILKRLYGIKNIKSINKFLTKENIEDVLTSHIKEKEIDILSIDIDGNDYCILKQIKYFNKILIIKNYIH